jgi:Nucleoporin Nup120/160
MAPPSWLKETPLRFEAIARHHSPALSVFLPAINDRGDSEYPPHTQYDFDVPDKSSETDPALDKEYQWANLAQDSGIYSSQQPIFPRSLLWRVVAGGTLTIHAIDSVRPRTAPRNRACAAIQFRFPVKLRPNCIGFSEDENRILVYALTEDCVLYILPLTEEDLRGENKRAETIVEAAKVHRPLFLQAKFGQGTVSLEMPHFMYVLPNSEKIIFAMQDGSIHQYHPSGSPLSKVLD